MNILFPYMARWNSANMSRYNHIFRSAAAAGHRVVVLQPPPRASSETNFVDTPADRLPNIEVETVRVPRFFWDTPLPADKFLKKAAYTLAAYLRLRSIARERRPDVLVVYNLPQYLYTFGIGLPVAFDYADDYIAMMDHELGRVARGPVETVARAVLERLIRKAVLVTSVSFRLHDTVRNDRKVLIPNGANPPGPRPITQPPGAPGRRPVIGYVGAFEYFIDLDLMLEAAARLPEADFLLVGGGREFERVRRAVAGRGLANVRLTGPLDHATAMRHLETMDVCLNLFTKGPVSHAASPIKLFEYWARRKPVVTTRLEEILRIDDDICYRADTLEEVVEAVRNILRDPEERDRRTARGYHLVCTQYNWQALSASFVAALADAVHAPPDRSPR